MATNPINPTVLREAKILYNFGLSECNRVKQLAQKHMSERGIPLKHFICGARITMQIFWRID